MRALLFSLMALCLSLSLPAAAKGKAKHKSKAKTKNARALTLDQALYQSMREQRQSLADYHQKVTHADGDQNVAGTEDSLNLGNESDQRGISSVSGVSAKKPENNENSKHRKKSDSDHDDALNIELDN